MADDSSFASRAAAIEWLLFDADGVLSDTTLLFTRRGEQLKGFNVRDGLGLRLAQRVGLKLGILSGRTSKPLEKRAAELDFDCVMLASRDKDADFDRFLAEQKTTADRVAYIGDDLPDLAVLARAGLSFTPADAVPEAKAAACTVLESRGGHGAAREMIERLLKARGEWQGVVARFSGG